MAYASPAHQPFLQASRPVQAARAVVKRRLPYGEFAVHSLALSVIVVLFWANQKEQFWKDFKLSDTRIRNELKGWQFAAKLHELVMLSSLSFVVFYYMRRLLLGRSGIPFGLVSVTYTIAYVSPHRRRAWVCPHVSHWPGENNQVLGLIPHSVTDTDVLPASLGQACFWESLSGKVSLFGCHLECLWLLHAFSPYFSGRHPRSR
jgi:hypothetical protein